MSTRKMDVISLLCILEVVVLGIVFIPKACPFLILPDEFGYWYNAARILKLPWIETAALGSYYSYGYSALLLPVLALFKSPILAYRVAIIVNFVLLLTSFAILRRDMGKESVLALLFPPLMIYALSTMCETFLFLLIVLTIRGLKKFTEDVSIKTGIMFLLPAFLAFITHNRMLPVFGLAILIAFEKCSDEGKKKSALSLVLLFLLLFALSFLAKNCFTYGIPVSEIYASTGFLAMLHKFGNLFSLEGILRFMVSLLGDVFYILVSTLGVAAPGIKRLVRKTRQKDDLSYFILVSLVLEALLSSLFLFGADSSVSVLYGRYLDPFCAVLLVLGAKELSETEQNLRWILMGVLAAAVGLIAVLFRIRGYGDYDGILSIGAGYLSFAFTQTKAFLVAAFALSFFIVLSLWVLAGNLGKEAFLRGLTISFAVLSVLMTVTVWDFGSSFVRGEEQITKELTGQSDEAVYYINEDDAYAVQILQFYLGKRNVRVIPPEEIALLPEKANVVTMSYSGLDEELSDSFENSITTNCFKLWIPR